MMVFLLPWVVLPIIVFVWLTILEPYVPLVRQFLEAIDRNDVQASFGLVILDALGSYAVIGYFLRRKGASWRDLGLRRFNAGKALLYIILILVGFSVLVGLLYALIQILLPGFNAEQPQTNEFTSVAPSMHLYSLLALVVIPPLVEEPVFRGFIFPAFSKRYGLIFGAVTSSILFGLAHFQPNVVVYTTLLGILLCFLYTRTGSIIPGMVIHMLNNYLAYTALN
jgi:membrane protease YdiL (CAAX protease family)